MAENNIQKFHDGLTWKWLFEDGTILPVVAGASDPNPAPEGEPDPEPPAEPDPQPDAIVIPMEKEPKDKTFSASDIEKARKEERDKLYKTLEAEKAARKEQEKILQELKAEADARKKAEEDARIAAEEAEKAREREEMSAAERMQAIEQEWQQKFEAERQQRELLAAMMERENQTRHLEQYRSQRIAEESDNLMPELVDLIKGDTEDQIEGAIALVKEKTASILAQVTAHQQQSRQQTKGPSVTAPPVGPMDNQEGYKTLTAEDLRNMSMDEYAKVRDTLMQTIKGRGPYDR